MSAARAARYFSTAAQFRTWLRRHHAKETELWVGFYKVGSGTPSMTWPQSVDEALCVGWIDGVRQRVDEQRYRIRFTPRRARSIWSAVNVRRMNELLAADRVLPAGRAAFAQREANRSGIYAYEQRSDSLPEPYASQMRANKKGAAFFLAQPPSYRKTIAWWVVSAKREDTRARRMATLIADSAAGRRVGLLK